MHPTGHRRKASILLAKPADCTLLATAVFSTLTQKKDLLGEAGWTECHTNAVFAQLNRAPFSVRCVFAAGISNLSYHPHHGEPHTKCNYECIRAVETYRSYSSRFCLPFCCRREKTPHATCCRASIHLFQVCLCCSVLASLMLKAQHLCFRGNNRQDFSPHWDFGGAQEELLREECGWLAQDRTRAFASLMLHLHKQPNVNQDFPISKGISIDLGTAQTSYKLCDLNVTLQENICSPTKAKHSSPTPNLWAHSPRTLFKIKIKKKYTNKDG